MRPGYPIARWAVVILGLLAGGITGVVAQPAREFQIKAVFLFNFAQFVQWPPDVFAGPDAPVVLGVLGRDPFGGDLDQAVRNEMIGARPLIVRRYRRIEDVDTCHVLYISQSEASRLGHIFTLLKGRGILTVGDMDSFALQGGMIRFLMENGKVRMRINPGAAREAGLTISSKLLRSAGIVTTEPN